MSQTSFLSLPVDILVLVFQYLDASSFLSLTSTCKDLHTPEFVYDNTFWSSLVRTTFRVPNQPVVQNDGKRWHKLCKRLLTQTRIYTWGNNEKGCLGHSYESSRDVPRALPRINGRRRQHISWPERMRRVDGLGIIADLQCGGWSTTLLTSKGALFTVGVMDGLSINPRPPRFEQRVMAEPVPLLFPPGYPHPYDRHDPSTAIKQFSAGRQHVLALSDSGRIWSWQNIEHAALNVKFLKHDTVENGRSAGRGVVKQVVAGWSKSAALIEGIGIVVWEPLQREHDESEIEDAALVLESYAIPGTGFVNGSSKESQRPDDDRALLAASIGEVRNFIVLGDMIIFNTHLGKVYTAKMPNLSAQHATEPEELPISPANTAEDAWATDVQGSHNSFAVFTQSGAVLTGDQDHVFEFTANRIDATELFTRIPALQHQDIIQVAFGDYHFHALHSPGYITSYGTEPQGCGALGLGGDGDGEGRMRGIRYQGRGGDGCLLPHAYTEGRRVWFEREKRAWIKFLTSGGVDPAEAIERQRMAIGSPEIACHGEVSEWVEQQGRDWESKYDLQDEDEDGLGAYFCLKVAAAGWHSGALMLVNEDLATKLKRTVEIPDPDALPKSQTIPPVSVTLTEPFDEQQQQPHDAENSGASTQTLLGRAVAASMDYGRWFLGAPPYNAAPPYGPDPAGISRNLGHGVLAGGTSLLSDFQRGLHPINYGAAPRVGVKYVWAEDHFPRLILADGAEMPGTVPFDEWRYPRPNWDLGFSL